MKTSLKKEVFLFNLFCEIMIYHQSEFDMAVSTAYSGFFFHPSGGASFMLSGTGYSSNILDMSSSPSTYRNKNFLLSNSFLSFPEVVLL